MSEVFFSSDFHYNHKNICRGTSSWDKFEKGGSHQQTRDFNSLDDMNKAIVKGINKKVGADDILYFLGDWSFGGAESIWEFRNQINCQHIHLIYGNHDHHIENNKLLKNPNPNHHITQLHATNLFESCQYVKTVNIGKNSFFLSHYAHRVWNKRHHGRIHLYGHSHASLEQEPYGRSMDVGIDAYYRIFKRYEPFSVKEIIDIMNNREVLVIDHHNSSTN